MSNSRIKFRCEYCMKIHDIFLDSIEDGIYATKFTCECGSKIHFFAEKSEVFDPDLGNWKVTSGDGYLRLSETLYPPHDDDVTDAKEEFKSLSYVNKEPLLRQLKNIGFSKLNLQFIVESCYEDSTILEAYENLESSNEKLSFIRLIIIYDDIKNPKIKEFLLNRAKSDPLHEIRKTISSHGYIVKG